MDTAGGSKPGSGAGLPAYLSAYDDADNAPGQSTNTVPPTPVTELWWIGRNRSPTSQVLQTSAGGYDGGLVLSGGDADPGSNAAVAAARRFVGQPSSAESLAAALGSAVGSALVR